MSTPTPGPLEATRTPPPGPLSLEEFLHHYGHRHAELVAGVPVLLDIYTEPNMASLRHGRVCYLAARAIGDHEVRSPSDLWTDVFAKVDEYLAAGTRVVVVLDPGTGEASVHRPGAQQQLIAADTELTLPDVLPGFAVPLAKLFE